MESTCLQEGAEWEGADWERITASNLEEGQSSYLMVSSLILICQYFQTSNRNN